MIYYNVLSCLRVYVSLRQEGTAYTARELSNSRPSTPALHHHTYDIQSRGLDYGIDSNTIAIRFSCDFKRSLPARVLSCWYSDASEHAPSTPDAYRTPMVGNR